MIDRLRAIIDRIDGRGTETRAIGFFVGSKSLSVRVATIAKVLMAVILVSAVTVVVGFAFLGFGSQPAFAVGVTADDISISTSDGNVTSVTVAPNLTHSWSNLDTGVQTVRTNIDFSDDGSSWTGWGRADKACVGDIDFDCGATTATVNQNIFTPIDVAGDTPVFSLSDFNASDGETTTTTVYVRFTIELLDDSENVIKQKEVVKSFDVSVTNKEGTFSVTGVVNTNVTTPTA